MSLLDIYNPFITEKTKNYSNWNEVFKDGTKLIVEIGNLVNPYKTENECEQWIFNTENFLKSKKVKEDYGFSKPLIFILQREINQTTIIKKKSFDTEELKREMERKINTLRTIRDSASSPISKTKVFDYREEHYFLNGHPINPNINTLYYVLFDATYQITPDGGEILYSQLKKYLKSKKINYTIKGKKINFQYENIKAIQEKVQNNLCGQKGILKLTSVRRYLTDKQKTGEQEIFSAIRNSKTYRFNNTQFK